MPNIFTKKILVIIIFFLVIFLLPQLVFAADASPDAIATRVFPNPNHLSPISWYKANIKKQGSPQALIVDGYEAIRDGRTVYVNAANIDLANNNFYTNIYLLSFNQNVEKATEDIFGQLLSHWKFNSNVSEEQKDKIRNDTKRLADLAEIKSALADYQKTHNGDFPALAAGSYVAGKSISVWPSWQATLGVELGRAMPLDPVNKLGSCPGYDPLTCWDQINKKFAGAPDNSRAYIYTYNSRGSYNICALMESGYLTALSQGACPGSAVGYAVDNCGNSEAGLGGFHKEGNQCVSNKKLNDPSCFYQAAGYDYGWKNFARIWENGVWQSSCVVYNCQNNFYYKYQPWYYAGVPVTMGGCQKCQVDSASGATAVKVRNGCQNTQCANPCQNTACAGGYSLYNGQCVKCQAGDFTGAVSVGLNGAGTCKITACVNGQHLSNDALACESNNAVCAITGGIGEKQWQAGINNWGSCLAVSCIQAADYYLYNGACVDCHPVASAGNATAAALDGAGQCKITACAGGYHPADNGLSCEIDPVVCVPTCDTAGQPNCKAGAPANAETAAGECCGSGFCFKCQNNYTWSGGTCAANTQTVLCAAKPANTDWNTSPMVLQTWTGSSSSWQPANASSYDATAGICKYKCQAGYDWNGSSCVASCVPDCAGKTCGDNGCGGSCGTCSLTQSCSGAGVCVANCTPNCAATGHNCGDDGCGGSCGICSVAETCGAGNCCNIVNYTPQIKIWASAASSQGWGIQKIISFNNQINLWDVSDGYLRTYKFTGTNVSGSVNCVNGRVSKAYGDGNKLYFQHYNGAAYEDCGYLTFDGAYVKGGVSRGFNGGSEDLEGPYWGTVNDNYLLFSFGYDGALADARDTAPHGRLYFDGIQQQVCCIPGQVNSGQATMKVCADNSHITYFNGADIASGNSWNTYETADIDITAGKNVIAIKGMDWGGGYGISAILSNGSCLSMSTAETNKWKCFQGSVSTDWMNIDFDDSSWSAAVQTTGAGPTGGNSLNVPMIWAQGAGAGATVYCRYTFNAN